MPIVAVAASFLVLHSPVQKTLVPPVRPVPPYDSAWTREAWTADENPYLAVRKEVEAYTLGRRVSQSKTDLVDQTARMLTAWRVSPKNPLLLYRAAYYAYMLAGLDYSPEAQRLLGAKESYLRMGSIPSPQSREYDRLRMLREGFLNEVFLDLGERLYKRDPDDVEIALKLIWAQAMYGRGNHKRALEIATRLLKSGDPKRYPAIYFYYGEAHDCSYLYASESERNQHAEQAFWGYRRYLDTGPAWRFNAIEANRRISVFGAYLKDHGQPVPSG